MAGANTKVSEMSELTAKILEDAYGTLPGKVWDNKFIMNDNTLKYIPEAEPKQINVRGI